MVERISAAGLTRRLGDSGGGVRCRGDSDSFLVERNGDPVARLAPVPGKAMTTLREALAAWRSVGKPDPGFADDLERLGNADRPPDDPWGS